MSVEFAWFLGAPLVGGAFVTAGIVVPRLKQRPESAATAREGASVLPLRARAVAPRGEILAQEAVPTAEGEGDAVRATDEADVVSSSAMEASDVHEVDLPIARPAFGARLATGFRRAFRSRRIVENEPTASDSRHDEAIVTQSSHSDEVNYGVVLSRIVAPTRDDAPPILETPLTAIPLVQLEPVLPPDPTENGIVDVDIPPGEDPAVWRANVAARERQLSEATANAQRVRDETAADEARRQREADAHDRQVELENIALAEEVRVRSEARARKWYTRLDLELEAPTVEVRMAMASSLAAVRAVWAGKLLREAFGQEDEPRVRARIIGALVSGDHLDVTEPFEVAFDHGGIERAATFERLMARQHEAQWIVELLAPLLVA